MKKTDTTATTRTKSARAIDVDGYLAADQTFRCTLRRASPGRTEHTGPTMIVLDEAEARQLVADLQAQLAELAPGASRQADAELSARLANLEQAAKTGVMSAGAALAHLAIDFRTGRVR